MPARVIAAGEQEAPADGRLIGLLSEKIPKLLYV